jgi:hypothetical protein
MTAGSTENAAAAQAVAAGMAAWATWSADAEAQQRDTTGSDVAVQDVQTPDDTAVAVWPSAAD